MTSKVKQQFLGHILVAFFKSFHLICDMTIFDHFQKIALGGPILPPQGSAAKILFSQTRVLQMRGACKKLRF